MWALLKVLIRVNAEVASSIVVGFLKTQEVLGRDRGEEMLIISFQVNQISSIGRSFFLKLKMENFFLSLRNMCNSMNVE